MTQWIAILRRPHIADLVFILLYEYVFRALPLQRPSRLHAIGQMREVGGVKGSRISVVVRPNIIKLDLA